MKTLLAFLLSIMTFQLMFSQNWLHPAGGLSNDESFDIEVDANGNFYTTGYVSGESVFGTDVTLISNGYSDAYITKTNSNGIVQWGKTFGGVFADRGLDLAVDPYNNIYVCGFFNGEADFGGITLNSTDGSQDAFLMKLDPSGNVIWAKSIGGSEGDTAYGVEVDSQGNVIVTGQFKSLVNFDGIVLLSEQDPSTGDYSFDIFVVKYDANGNFQWVRQGKAPQDDRGLALSIDPDDNILMTGQFSDTLEIAGVIHENTVDNSGFVLKLDQSGNELWFRRLSAFQVLAYDLEVDEDRVYATGDFLGNLSVFDDEAVLSTLNGEATYQVFLMRFDIEGNLEWSLEDGSDSPFSSKAIAVDSNRDIYITGTFKCSLDEYANDEEITPSFYSTGFRDVFITKYDEDGERIWADQSGGPKDDYCSGIAVGSGSSPAIAGSFQNNFSTSSYTGYDVYDWNQIYTNSLSGCSDVPTLISIEAAGNKDIFISKPYHPSANDYNLFLENCGSLNTPYIIGADSLLICWDPSEPDSVTVQTNAMGNGEEDHIDDIIGPLFDFNWSNGDDYFRTEITETGNYTCEISRQDGCYSVLDSIHVVIESIPESPLLTDDHGFNTLQAYQYNEIDLCSPDTALVELTFDDDVYDVYYHGPGIFSTLYEDPFEVHEEGNYYLTVVSESGCQQTFPFVVDEIVNFPPEIIDPHLFLSSGQDSITVCAESTVSLVVLDSLTNPNLDLSEPFYTLTLYDPLQMESDSGYVGTNYTPGYTGWHTYQFDFILGYNNVCGLDTIHYSAQAEFYVELLPLPEIEYNLYGNVPYCPGDTVAIWTDNIDPGLDWSGLSIVWNSADNDSILVNASDIYSLSGTIVNPDNGCSDYFYQDFNLYPKTNPVITSNAVDDLICPGDSLLLTCDYGDTFDWIGPDGQLIGTEQTVWVTTPGFYHCVITDEEGCILTSNTLELFEYNSPFLIPEPSTDLCFSGYVELTAVYSGAPDFFWHEPINSSEASVTVNDPGTYVVEVSQCGTTLLDSIVITDSGFTAEIIPLSDLFICPGESVELTTLDDMETYVWSDGQTGQTVFISQPGEYSVLLGNDEGCYSLSDPIIIDYYPGGYPPVTEDQVVCLGDSVSLFATASSTITWYDSDLNVLGEGENYDAGVINENTTFYVSNHDENCTSELVPVNVLVDDDTSNPVYYLPEAVCDGETVIISTEEIPEGEYYWSLPNGTFEFSSSIVISDIDSSYSGQYTLTVMNDFCSSETIIDSMIVNQNPELEVELSQDYLCFGDTIIGEATGNYDSIVWAVEENEISNQDEVVITEGGILYVSASNENCSTTYYANIYSNNVNEITESLDTISCGGESLTLILGEDDYYWSEDFYLDEITLSNTIETGELEDDVTYYFGTIDSLGCPESLNAYSVIVFSSSTPTIDVIGSLCEESELILSSDFTESETVIWIDPLGNEIESTNLIIEDLELLDGGEYLVYGLGNDCLTDTGSVNIDVLPLPEIPEISGSQILCVGDTLNLIFDNYIDSISSYWQVGFSFYNSEELIISDANTFNTDNIIAVSVQEGCQSLLEVEIEFYPETELPLLPEAEILCDGETIALDLNEDMDNQYFWYFLGDLFSVDPEINELEEGSGHYVLEVIDLNGCSNQDSIYVQVDENPLLDLGPDLNYCFEEPLELSVESGFDSYSWSTGEFSNTILVSEPGTYWVEVINGVCSSADSLIITSEDCLELQPINIFTPNEDGINDEFFLDVKSAKILDVSIYNRWGQKVGHWTEVDGSWDGTHYLTDKDVAEGTYFYTVMIVDFEDHKTLTEGTVYVKR